MLSKRERLMAIGVGVAVGLLALDYFVIAPVTASLDALEQQKNALQSQFDKSISTIKLSHTAVTRLGDFRSAGLNADASATESNLLNSLRAWSVESNVQVSSIRPDRATEDHGINELSFRATAEGSMRSVASFLYLIETAKIPIRIREIQVASRTEGSDDLTVDLTISTLWEDVHGAVPASKGGNTP